MGSCYLRRSLFWKVAFRRSFLYFLLTDAKFTKAVIGFGISTEILKCKNIKRDRETERERTAFNVEYTLCFSSIHFATKAVVLFVLLRTENQLCRMQGCPESVPWYSIYSFQINFLLLTIVGFERVRISLFV